MTTLFERKNNDSVSRPQLPPEYGTVADHDQLPELTVSEYVIDRLYKELFGPDDGLPEIGSFGVIGNSAWSQAVDQYFRERIVHVKSNNVLLLRFAYSYEVDLCRIKTERHLLGWILQLTEKPWMNSERIQKFFEAVVAIKQFKLHGREANKRSRRRDE